MKVVAEEVDHSVDGWLSCPVGYSSRGNLGTTVLTVL
jgi:hypothetical protein